MGDAFHFPLPSFTWSGPLQCKIKKRKNQRQLHCAFSERWREKKNSDWIFRVNSRKIWNLDIYSLEDPHFYSSRISKIQERWKTRPRLRRCYPFKLTYHRITIHQWKRFCAGKWNEVTWRHIVTVLLRKLPGDFGNNMQANDWKDKSQTQDQNHHRVHPQPRTLIRVQLQHCSRWAPGASGTGGTGPGISQRLFMICSSSTAKGCSWSTWGSRWRRTTHGRSGGSRGGGTRARRFVLWSRFGAWCQGGRSTGRGH